MKRNLFFAALITALWPMLLSAQPWQAAKRYSASFGSTALRNSAVAASPDGSTYIVGTLNGAATFDNVTLTTPVGTDQGYLLKLDTNFQAVWGATFPYFANDVTTDAEGNVFVVGAQLAPQWMYNPFPDSLTCVSKYHSTGQLLATFISTGIGKSRATAVSTDAAGNCYVGGSMLGPVTFGAYSPFYDGGIDCYLMKLSPDLSDVSWAVVTGSSSSNDVLDDLEVDNNGYVYTSGRVGHSTYCCGPFCWFTCQSGDYFVDRHSAANGNMLKHKDFHGGGYGSSAPHSMALDPTGQSVFTAANFNGTTTVAPGISLTAGGQDIFVTHLSASDLSVQWAKKISTADRGIYPQGMEWVNGSLYLHGFFYDSVQIGNNVLIAAQEYNPFVAQVAPAAGTVLSAEAFTGINNDYGYGIAVNGNRLVVTGNTASPALASGDFYLAGTSKSIYVAQKIFPPPLALNLVSATPVTCHGGSDGSATLAASGGTAPYTYTWSNGTTGAAAANLSAGNYTVTVTDNAGFQATISVTIAEPPTIQVQASDIQNVSCAGLSDGLITVAATGGTPPFTYAWNNGDTGLTAANLIAGTYVVTVTDANGCIQTFQVTVSAEFNDVPTAGFTSDINGATVSFSNTSADATSYLWNFGDPASGGASTEANPSHTYTVSGAYTVTLIASNPCGADTVVQTVGVVGAKEPSWLKNFRIFPNPNNGIFTVEISGDAADDIEFALFGPDGRLLRRETVEFGSGVLTQNFDYGDLPPALYLLRIQAGEKTAFEKLVVQR